MNAVPGPPSPPIVPGYMGWPSRERLDALAATLSIFEWLDANGIDSPEVTRVKTAFMFEHGPTAQRWLDQADPPPSWEQMAWLIRDNDRLREGLAEARSSCIAGANAIEPRNVLGRVIAIADSALSSRNEVEKP